MYIIVDSAFFLSNGEEMLLYFDFSMIVQCAIYIQNNKMHFYDGERRNFLGGNVDEYDSFEKNSKQMHLSPIFQFARRKEQYTIKQNGAS